MTRVQTMNEARDEIIEFIEGKRELHPMVRLMVELSNDHERLQVIKGTHPTIKGDNTKEILLEFLPQVDFDKEELPSDEEGELLHDIIKANYQAKFGAVAESEEEQDKILNYVVIESLQAMALVLDYVTSLIDLTRQFNNQDQGNPLLH